MCGFTGAGYPKEVPLALAERMNAAHARGETFRIGVWTGASTAPELDGALAKVDGIEMRLPYQSDPTCRKRINAGEMEYIDIHLSHVAQFVWCGFLGKLDVAIVEVAGVREDGRLIPSSSVGNNKTWLDRADKVILEVNAGRTSRSKACTTSTTAPQLPPHRKPIPLVDSRRPHRRAPICVATREKVIAVVETDTPDRNSAFSPPDENSRRIADHIIEFLAHEVKMGRLPQGSAAAAIGRRQRRQRGDGRHLQNGALRQSDRLYRGVAGRDVQPDPLGQDDLRFGHGLVAEPRRGARVQPRRRRATATRSCCGRRKSATIRK